MKNNPYREQFKIITQELQRIQAEVDVALGNPPRKTSKTYINAYSNAYALEQMIDNRTACHE